MIRVETNPRSRAIHTIELSKVETLACIDPKGRPCKGIDMVRRFNGERSYGERVKNAGRIILDLKDNFDLRHYTPVDARICRRVPDVVGIFDHAMEKLGIPQRMERSIRFFMDGSLLTSPGGAEQWILYANKVTDQDEQSTYRCNWLRADLERGKYDYSLVLC
jgi:hypothetical protein